jgi:hypothetical protein
VVLHIHTLILNEVFMSNKLHITACASIRSLNRTSDPTATNRGHCHDGLSGRAWLWRFKDQTCQQEDIDDDHLLHPLPD